MDESVLSALADKFSKGLNEHDSTGLAQLYTEDAVMFSPGGLVSRGRNAITEDIESWFRAFPDVKMDFHSALISGNHMVIEWNFVGTHDGPMASPKGDIPPTGKAVNLKGVMIFRVAQEGLVEEDRTYFDTADLMAQLGLSD